MANDAEDYFEKKKSIVNTIIFELYYFPKQQFSYIDNIRNVLGVGLFSNRIKTFERTKGLLFKRVSFFPPQLDLCV